MNWERSTRTASCAPRRPEGHLTADGRARALPLLAEGLIHDWHYILGRLGLLQSAEAVGRLIFVLGALTMLAALVLLGLDARRCRNVPASSAEPV